MVQVGEYLLDGFRRLQQKHDIIGDVRGRGLMTGMELVRDRTTKEPAKEETVQVRQRSLAATQPPMNPTFIALT